MKYYSTNHQAPDASLEEAVVKGLASDKGLYMPEAIKPLPQEFYDQIENLSFQEIAYRVADAFFGEDVPAETLKQIVYDTLSFDVPAVKVKDNIYSYIIPNCSSFDKGFTIFSKKISHDFSQKRIKKQDFPKGSSLQFLSYVLSFSASQFFKCFFKNCWHFSCESHCFTCFWMCKAKCLSMQELTITFQCLTWSV